MDLRAELLNWDGRTAADIADIYQRYKAVEGFHRCLITLMGEEVSQRGATWLLKRYLQDGGYLGALEIASIYKLLPVLAHWESRLHLLQSIPFMPIAKTEKITVERFLRKSLSDDNKFVRAWAYSGFYELSLQYEEYREETTTLMEMALRDEVPSVKARVRKIVSKGF